jgi:hypothetical protein
LSHYCGAKRGIWDESKAAAGHFNGTLRREVLEAEWFGTTRQSQTVINQWLNQYNQIRPHQALRTRPPAPEKILENRQISST